jgi:hypothetical protein
VTGHWHLVPQNQKDWASAAAVAAAGTVSQMTAAAAACFRCQIQTGWASPAAAAVAGEGRHANTCTALRTCNFRAGSCGKSPAADSSPQSGRKGGDSILELRL